MYLFGVYTDVAITYNHLIVLCMCYISDVDG